MPDFDRVTKQVFALYAKKDYEKGLRVSIQAGRTFPRMRDRTSYWVARFYSLLGESEAALSTLHDAVGRGCYWNEDALLQEPDLKPLHGDTRFDEIVRRSEQLRKSAQRHVKPGLRVFIPRVSKGKKFPLMVTLHGRTGNAAEHAKRWASLTSLGVVCAVPQSSQLFQKGAYCWDDTIQAQKEVSDAFKRIVRSYPIDPRKVLIGGKSQGGALAVKIALEQKPLKTKGFVVNVPAFEDVDSLVKLVPSAARNGLRGYFFTGENDPGRVRIEKLYHEMDTGGLPCRLVVHPKLGHDYPENFGPKLASAVKFVLSPATECEARLEGLRQAKGIPMGD
jgi:acetyl esterase/lipase